MNEGSAQRRDADGNDCTSSQGTTGLALAMLGSAAVPRPSGPAGHRAICPPPAPICVIGLSASTFLLKILINIIGPNLNATSDSLT